MTEPKVQSYIVYEEIGEIHDTKKWYTWPIRYLIRKLDSFRFWRP